MIRPSGSVGDPDPQDPYVFRPPGSGSGSISTRNGSGSKSFYNQAKTVRKTLIPTGTSYLLLYDFVSSKNDVVVPSKSNKQKTLKDPDPYQMLRIRNTAFWKAFFIRYR